MPIILAEYDGKWQSNLGRAELLSIIATKHAAQTNRCLTDIIPVLSGLMWDTKPQVKSAATDAMTICVPQPPLAMPYSHADPGCNPSTGKAPAGNARKRSLALGSSNACPTAYASPRLHDYDEQRHQGYDPPDRRVHPET